jgi:hypothetical protein
MRPFVFLEVFALAADPFSSASAVLLQPAIRILNSHIVPRNYHITGRKVWILCIANLVLIEIYLVIYHPSIRR